MIGQRRIRTVPGQLKHRRADARKINAKPEPDAIGHRIATAGNDDRAAFDADPKTRRRTNPQPQSRAELRRGFTYAHAKSNVPARIAQRLKQRFQFIAA